MTQLGKPIRRTLSLVLDNRRARERDRVVVTLYPSGVIGFRFHRCRTEFTLPLARVMLLAIRAHVEEQNRGKRRRRSR